MNVFTKCVANGLNKCVAEMASRLLVPLQFLQSLNASAVDFGPCRLCNVGHMMFLAMAWAQRLARDTDSVRVCKRDF